MYNKICEYCENKYSSKYKSSKFCSRKCSDLGRKKSKWNTEKLKRKNIICPTCKEIIEVHTCSKKIYCSNRCRYKSTEWRKNNSKSHKGLKRSKEVREKISKSKVGIKFSNSHRKNLSDSHKGNRLSKKTKEKLRLIHISRIKNNHNQWQSYNDKASEWFHEFDKHYNTSGDYAKNNNGERCIKGFYVDYINDDLKIIIEWDESYHYKNGKLSNKDIKRQELIQLEYPNYKFIRIIQDSLSSLVFNSKIAEDLIV